MQSSEVSFGEIHEGGILEKVVEVINKSNNPVAIVQAIPECGCLVVDFRSVTLAPGGSLKAKVKFFTQGFTGMVKKTVTFLSNSMITPEVTVSLVGRIVAPFEVSPAQLVFPDQLSSENSLVKSLKITSRADKRNHSYRVRTLSSNIMIEKIKGGNSSVDEYRIKLIPPLPEGDFSSAISIRSDEKDVGGKVIPVYARILAPLEVERNVLPFGLVERGRTYTRDVKLKVTRPGLIINQSDIETSCDCLTTELQHGKGNEYVLRISLDASKAPDMRLVETVKISFGETVTALRVSAYFKQ